MGQLELEPHALLPIYHPPMLPEQVAQLELERHEGAEELEQWRRGKLRFSHNSQEGLRNNRLHAVTPPPALRSVKSLPRRRSSYSM